MTRPEARWANGVCKTCGQYTHSCKCEHPGSELFKSLFAAPQGGEHSMAGPAHDGEPAVAASWIDAIPTAADGVTCRIADVRRAFREFTGARTEELSLKPHIGPFIEVQAVTDAMVDRFLSWRLPASVCADGCATNPNYPHPRSGTNLLNADEARQMLEHVMVAFARSPLATQSAPKGLPDYPLQHLPGCVWPECECAGRWHCKQSTPQKQS